MPRSPSEVRFNPGRKAPIFDQINVPHALCFSKWLLWAMSERMTKKLVIDALQMAIWARKPPRGLIIHSDRGSQYCSREYQEILNLHGLVCSMSKRGDCYDNAAMESWNHSFKIEAIHGERFATRDSIKKHVFEYIEIYYNRKRPHSMLGYKSPVAFEVNKMA